MSQISQTIRLSKELINDVDLSDMIQYIEWHDNKQYFELESGKEHYKMLAYIVSQLKESAKVYIDIGTYLGFSAAAMAMDKDSKVISYDIFDWIPENKLTIKNRENVELRVMNCLDDMESLLQSDFICLDIAHDAVVEQEILTALKEHDYKGLLFLDDIHLNKEMHDWWNSIDLPKIDLTKYGHWSGSGILVFDTSRFEIICE